MSQEIRHFTWCDPCAKEGHDYEPATTVKVAVGDGRPVTVDVCERHDKMLLGPMRDLVAEYGHRADVDRTVVPTTTPGRETSSRRGRKPHEPESHPCPWCDERYGSVSGLSFHLVKGHGFPGNAENQNRADLTGILGGACPYCGKAAASPSKFGMHIYRNHKGEPTRMAAAVARAREMGDPAGVVAKVLAKAPDGRYRKPRR